MMNINNILCFGDSITHGDLDTLKGGWVERLKLAYFHQVEQSVTANASNSLMNKVYNLGVGGDTTDGLVSRFEAEFKARVFSKSQSNIILAYGLNDLVIHKNKNKVPIAIFIRHLEQCLTFAVARKARIGLMSVLPIPIKVDGKLNAHGNIRLNDDVVKYNHAIMGLANQYNASYIDTFSAFNDNHCSELFCPDQVHPNSDGHELIFQRAWQFLNQSEA